MGVPSLLDTLAVARDMPAVDSAVGKTVSDDALCKFAAYAVTVRYILTRSQLAQTLSLQMTDKSRAKVCSVSFMF